MKPKYHNTLLSILIFTGMTGKDSSQSRDGLNQYDLKKSNSGSSVKTKNDSNDVLK